MTYNGIVLPKQWPPNYGAFNHEPTRAPYLDNPPEIVPIEVGRQLFVDDFLIEHTSLQRTFHPAEYYPSNPVLKPNRPWEVTDDVPFAAVFSDGVWYDAADETFKMWYMGRYMEHTCLATSTDGVHWEKPELDVVPGTNVVLVEGRDSSTAWLDHSAKDPGRRFVRVTWLRHGGRLGLRFSADGIHWSDQVAASPPTGDRTTIFYNPFRGVWVWSLRDECPNWGRSRAYREHPDLVAGMTWEKDEVVPWVGADRLDPHNPDPEFDDIEPQLYNLDATPYESLILGLFSVWQGPENDVCHRRRIHKRNEVLLGFSRDGFHWHRPDRRPFIGVSEDLSAWNCGNVQSAGGGCLVVGDRLYFYVSGRSLCPKLWDGGGNTGLAVLRRDGFASMDAGQEEGVLTTRPVRFTGTRLFVNVNAPDGELTAEVLDARGEIIEPFSRANCLPVSADRTLHAIEWKNAALAALVGRPVKFRFTLRNGSLYAFWVSPDGSGASHGYVAAGGPGFTGSTDTVGIGPLR